ncbi:MAG TPA: thioredoxin domain-containing protein [Ktedonobacteraceae bacterium]|nr:thioredoxin domain-containing protein [Ktedonobacteraceae bacterium]
MTETNEAIHTESHHSHTNRLINETSPYLLQHAHNPVNWYPWGEEALRKAQAEDKPILLSVGYSACHWCHAMERESFENERIAGVMNEHFVSIKVDREERPDIDGIYMQAVQAITRQGGWPMTVFLTPDGRPFYGGTYFPPQDRQYGRQTVPGFQSILLSVANLYAKQRTDVEEQAEQLATFLRQKSDAPLRTLGTLGTLDSVSLDLLSGAGRELSDDFDETYGGFGSAPKFPNTMSLEFLLRLHLHRQRGEIAAATGTSELEIIEASLKQMAHGGIYDQLGGGFHRYSVDAEWLVPHFEKMLYDNALLSRIYLHTHLVTGDVFYRRVVTQTLDYVVREMTSPEGGFYSTQDADSEGEEGKFFLWTPAEVEALLPPKDAQLFMLYYDVSQRGNFEGKNILHVIKKLAVIAEGAGISEDELKEILQRGRALLFAEREKRIKPARDEKVLTAWNGLMLRSFAEAARHLQRPDYLRVARRNAEFLLRELAHDGRLLRTYKDGHAHLNGYLEDYIFLADGLLALYEADLDPRWFSEARRLVDEAIALFADEPNGGFFDTGSDHEELLSRPKDIMDNATPAGNSVAAEVLLRLAAWTGETSYRQRADDYLRSLTDLMVKYPQSFGYALGALDFALSPAREIAIVGDPQQPGTRSLLAVVNQRYLPNSVLASAAPADAAAILAISLLANRPLKDGQASAYVCQNFACQAPVTSGEELAALV